MIRVPNFAGILGVVAGPGIPRHLESRMLANDDEFTRIFLKGVESLIRVASTSP
jgi:hypothetical protein